MGNVAKDGNSQKNDNIRQRPNGLYEGRIAVGGVRKSVYGSSKQEVKRKIKQLKRDFDSKKINPKTDTLYEYSCKWIYKTKYNRIEMSSYDRLENLVENQIKNSKCANKQFGMLKTDDINLMLVELVNPPEGMPAFALSTAKKVYELIKNMFDEAIAEKELSYSPMHGVVLPSKSICTVPAKETFSLTPQQIKTLKYICLTKNQDGTYKYRYGLIVLMMLNLGIRVGEMLALDFQDFNETDMLVKISKSFQSNTKYRGEDKEIKRVSCIKEPKTKNSNRIIPYGKEVDWLLQEIKKDNEKRGIVTDCVCSSFVGGRPTARNLQRTLDTMTEKTDLPHIWLHLLRHTFGSELLRRGIEISVVSRLMGHANANITYSTYIHVLDEEKAKAMKMFSIS